jgi:hypothetical protein
MRIVYDPSSIHRSNSGSVTGVVYFDFGADGQFPVAGWNDFVVVIATWWLAAFDEIGDAKTPAVFRFMDGPFWISADRRQGSKVRLCCVEDRRGAGPVREVLVDQVELQRELVGFARAVSQSCDAAHIASTDLDNLRKRLPK